MSTESSFFLLTGYYKFMQVWQIWEAGGGGGPSHLCFLVQPLVCLMVCAAQGRFGPQYGTKSKSVPLPKGMPSLSRSAHHLGVPFVLLLGARALAGLEGGVLPTMQIPARGLLGELPQLLLGETRKAHFRYHLVHPS